MEQRAHHKKKGKTCRELSLRVRKIKLLTYEMHAYTQISVDQSPVPL